MCVTGKSMRCFNDFSGADELDGLNSHPELIQERLGLLNHHLTFGTMLLRGDSEMPPFQCRLDKASTPF
jgi:hypothetical protein